MLPLGFLERGAAPLKVLFLGAHCDDIEIGCGGTILRLVAGCSGLQVVWVVFSSTPEREQEARTSASRFLQGATLPARIEVKQFRDGFFPYQGIQIKEFFEELKQAVDPDLIFTHYRQDRHQDHRTISDLTWNTWRRHLILEYEVPKYDGDLGTPNFFVPLDQDICGLKSRTICDVFRSEAGKGWLTEDTLHAIMRLRGVECASPGRYAEAFHCRKLVLGVNGS